jgi:hypothetical protein
MNSYPKKMRIKILEWIMNETEAGANSVLCSALA